VVNPAAAKFVTTGKLKTGAQVFAKVKTGAKGKMTTLTALLSPHGPDPNVPAEVVPHAALNM